jgi:hypothetical protein
MKLVCFIHLLGEAIQIMVKYGMGETPKGRKELNVAYLKNCLQTYHQIHVLAAFLIFRRDGILTFFKSMYPPSYSNIF